MSLKDDSGNLVAVKANGILEADALIGGKLYKKGRFAPGYSGNLKGRPKKPKETDFDKKVLQRIFKESDGDPYEFMKLMLKYGAELGLDVKTGMRLASEIAPYEKPKKASVETLSREYKTIEFKMVLPEDYKQLKYENTVGLLEAYQTPSLDKVKVDDLDYKSED